MCLFNFPLSAYSSLLIDTVRISLQTLSKFESSITTTFNCTHYSAVRVQGNNADKASGLFFYTELCILFFSFNMLSVRVLTENSTHSDGSNEESFSEG